MPDDDFQTAGYWEGRYQAGDAPWELPGMPRRLARWISAHRSGGHVLIPGCGSGREIAAFQQGGWKVTAIDFAPAAVERARARPGVENARLIVGDFFTYDFFPNEFDLIYERTFLTAISPERWPAVRARYARLLKGRGQIAGYFFYGHNDDPPPYGQPPDQPSFLAANFELTEDGESEDALPVFGDRERWQTWAKTGR